MGAGAGSSEVAPAHLGAAHLPTKAPSSQRDLRPKQGYRKSERILFRACVQAKVGILAALLATARMQYCEKMLPFPSFFYFTASACADASLL